MSNLNVLIKTYPKIYLLTEAMSGCCLSSPALFLYPVIPAWLCLTGATTRLSGQEGKAQPHPLPR